MPKLSVNQLSEFTGSTRATIIKRLEGLPFDNGPHKSKLYDSKAALYRIILGAAEDSGQSTISPQEATRQLTIARKEQIDVEVEVAKKKRIPIELVNEVDEQALRNVLGILKAHEGKVLTTETLTDMIAELHSVGKFLREWTS